MEGCPCKDCDRRKVNCHGICQDYGDWAKKNERIRNQRHTKEYQDAISFNDSFLKRRKK